MDKNEFNAFASKVRAFAKQAFSKGITVNNIADTMVMYSVRHHDDDVINQIDVEVRFWVDRIDITTYIKNKSSDMLYALDKSCFDVKDDYNTWDAFSRADDIDLLAIIFEEAEKHMQLYNLTPIQTSNETFDSDGGTKIESAVAEFKVKPL